MQPQYSKKINFIVNVIYGLIIILIVYIALKYALRLISPFLFAFVIAYVLKKPAKFLSYKLKLPYNPVAIVIVLIFYSTIGLIIALLGVKLISTVASNISQISLVFDQQIKPYFTSAFDIIERAVYRIDPAIVDALNSWFNQFVKSLGDNLTNISITIVTAISNFASSLPGFLIRVLLMIISTFFIACDYDKLSRFVLRQFSDKGSVIILSTKQYVIETLFVCIRSYAIIMTITFLELSLGLSVIGFSNSILLALVIALFDILPVLGTGGVMIPWTIFTFFNGDYKTALGLLIVYIVITVVRNIIEPKIVGSQLGLHPVVTLMSMFVGVNLFGVVGMFGFPIILSLLRHLNDTGTIKIFK